jgi:hypothetical protein
MDQPRLIVESIWEALTDTVRALGGARVVGKMLRPQKDVEAAQRWLLDALNPNREQTLSPEDVMLILRAAREKNVHIAMSFINSDAGYEAPRTVDPEDEEQALEREFIDSAKRMEGLVRRIERIREARARVTPIAGRR